MISTTSLYDTLLRVRPSIPGKKGLNGAGTSHRNVATVFAKDERVRIRARRSSTLPYSVIGRKPLILRTLCVKQAVGELHAPLNSTSRARYGDGKSSIDSTTTFARIITQLLPLLWLIQYTVGHTAMMALARRFSPCINLLYSRAKS